MPMTRPRACGSQSGAPRPASAGTTGEGQGRGFVRAAIDAHWGTDSRGVRPLAGKRALDVGCGAGLLCEPLARLGAQVTGVDAAQENIAAASAHAAGGGLAIDYRCGEIGALGLSGFDLVTSLEVIEHVADPRAFTATCASMLKPGGVMFVATLNRTFKSFGLDDQVSDESIWAGRGFEDVRALSALATQGDGERFKLPRPLLNSGDFNFSFSGLKTAVLYLTKKLAEYTVKLSTIARGIPIGGDLEYTDEITLGRSIVGRVVYE